MAPFTGIRQTLEGAARSRLRLPGNTLSQSLTLTHKHPRRPRLPSSNYLTLQGGAALEELRGASALRCRVTVLALCLVQPPELPQDLALSEFQLGKALGTPTVRAGTSGTWKHSTCESAEQVPNSDHDNGSQRRKPLFGVQG